VVNVGSPEFMENGRDVTIGSRVLAANKSNDSRRVEIVVQEAGRDKAGEMGDKVWRGEGSGDTGPKRSEVEAFVALA
jgi:hypothetical protein